MDRITGFLGRRRTTLITLGAVAASGYALVGYAKRRFSELQIKLAQDRAARDNLRKRFQQNQDDCTFTVSALLPSVAQHLNEELDVEAVTTALHERTAYEKAAALHASTSSLGDSVVKVEPSSQPPTMPNGDTAPASYADAASKPADEATSAAVDAPALSESTASVSTSAGPPVTAESVSSLPPPPIEREPAPVEPSDPRSKLELWTQIKLLSVSRTLSSVYLLAYLVLQTRVQLNILGRRSYLASVKALTHRGGFDLHEDEISQAFADAVALERTTVDGKVVLAQTEREYLTFSWWLLHRGWREVAQSVRKATEEVFGPVALKTALTQAQLAGLIEQVRRKVESDESLAARVMFPSRRADQIEVLRQATGDETINAVTPDLQALLDETADILDSPDFPLVLRACLDSLHASLLASLDVMFGLPPVETVEEGPISELREPKPCRLANLLPAIARQSQAVLTGYANTYLEALSEIPDLEAFSAIIYSQTRDLL